MLANEYLRSKIKAVIWMKSLWVRICEAGNTLSARGRALSQMRLMRFNGFRVLLFEQIANTQD